VPGTEATQTSADTCPTKLVPLRLIETASDPLAEYRQEIGGYSDRHVLGDADAVRRIVVREPPRHHLLHELRISIVIH